MKNHSQVYAAEGTDTEAEATVGTSKMGSVVASFTRIVDVFGWPTDTWSDEGSAVEAQWILKTPHGIATLYNWKDGKAYLGEEDGLDVVDITEWNIGGKHAGVVELIQEALAE